MHKKKKRNENELENKITIKITKMEKELASNINDREWNQKLVDLKIELEEIRQYRIQGAFIRSRWQNENLGEKPSKFFLNLENKNFISKHIREIKTNNKVIHNPEHILEEMRNFYENLFKERDSISIEETTFKDIEEKLLKLNEEDKAEIEAEISLEELKLVVMKSKNNKSPGPDGYTNEFFKLFWPNIKTLLLQLLNSYRTKGYLNSAQLAGTITCIPKGGKIRNNLKNWRPITLLNSIYKFFSSLIAYRIKKILPKLINPDQKGFIDGRFIGENSRLMYDIIEECSHKNIKGLIILIDFEKAFDSISWNFISKTLNIFNFGTNTIKWINSLQSGSTS